ncbi:hypothetical protein GCM10027425_04150 [Alteromonas gracilis]
MRSTVIAPVLLAALALTACGGSDEPAADSAPSASSSAPAPEESSEAPAEESTRPTGDTPEAALAVVRAAYEDPWEKDETAADQRAAIKPLFTDEMFARVSAGIPEELEGDASSITTIESLGEFKQLSPTSGQVQVTSTTEFVIGDQTQSTDNDELVTVLLMDGDWYVAGADPVA